MKHLITNKSHTKFTSQNNCAAGLAENESLFYDSSTERVPRAISETWKRGNEALSLRNCNFLKAAKILAANGRSTRGSHFATRKQTDIR